MKLDARAIGLDKPRRNCYGNGMVANADERGTAMRTATHMEYRWAVRAFRQDGTTALYPQGEIKARARVTARMILNDNPEYVAVQVVDGYEELPPDEKIERGVKENPQYAASREELAKKRYFWTVTMRDDLMGFAKTIQVAAFRADQAITAAAAHLATRGYNMDNLTPTKIERNGETYA